MRGVRVCLQASLIALLLLLGTCNLSLQVKEPYLQLEVQAAYQSTDDITIHFKFTADEPALRARYTLSTPDALIESGTTEPLSPGVEYERSIDLPDQFDEGKYLFRLVVQAERGGEFVDLTFLDKTAEFYVDHTAPASAPIHEQTEVLPDGFHVYLSHPEWAAPTGSPVALYYTLDGSSPTPSAKRYNPASGIVVPLTEFDDPLSAKAYDLAGNFCTYMLTLPQVFPDSQAPTSPTGLLASARFVGEQSTAIDAHPEWSIPMGSPVHIFYKIDGDPRDIDHVEYFSGTITLPDSPTPYQLRVVAVDEAGNESALVTRDYSFLNIVSAINPAHFDSSGHINNFEAIQLTGYGFDPSSATVKLFDSDGTLVPNWGGISVTATTVAFTVDLRTIITPGLNTGVGRIDISQSVPNLAVDSILFEILP